MSYWPSPLSYRCDDAVFRRTPICVQLMVARKQLGNLYEAMSFTQIAIQFLKSCNAYRKVFDTMLKEVEDMCLEVFCCVSAEQSCARKNSGNA